jgi:hypothetical protein
MKGKDVEIYFSEDANGMYEELQERILEQKRQGIENSSDMQLLRSIEREKENLKINPQRGIAIPKRNVSKQIAQRYGTDKIWKLNLVGYWRAIYTLTGDEIRIIPFILEIMDHRQYDKVFGYRKK